MYSGIAQNQNYGNSVTERFYHVQFKRYASMYFETCNTSDLDNLDKYNLI